MLAESIADFFALYLPWFGLAVGAMLFFLCGVRRLRSSRLLLMGTILMVTSAIFLLMQLAINR